MGDRYSRRPRPRAHLSSDEYRCRDCAQTYDSLQGLLRHTDICNHERPLPCATATCTFYAWNRESLLRHCDRRGHIFPRATRECSFQCEDCTSRFHTLTELLRHADKARHKRPFLCANSGCHFFSWNSEGLRKHCWKAGHEPSNVLPEYLAARSRGNPVAAHSSRPATEYEAILASAHPDVSDYLTHNRTLSETDLVLMHQFDVDEMVSTRHNDENNGSVTKVPETNAAKLAKTQCTTLGSHNGMRERSPDIDMSRKVRARTEPGPIPKVLRNVACPFCKKTGLLTAIAQHLEAGCNGATMAGLDAWLLHWEDQMHKLGALIAPRIVPDDRAGLC